MQCSFVSGPIGIAKDYTIKGWVMDDERLQNGGVSADRQKYFDALA
ncbi:MAG: hypothetical protein ACLRZG_07680 [Streptococcus sp.]